MSHVMKYCQKILKTCLFAWGVKVGLWGVHV